MSQALLNVLLSANLNNYPFDIATFNCLTSPPPPAPTPRQKNGLVNGKGQDMKTGSLAPASSAQNAMPWSTPGIVRKCSF